MTGFRYHESGLDQFQKAMDNLRLRQDTAIANGIKAALVHLYGVISPYPPAPPDSTYERGTDPRSEQLSKQWDYEGSGLKQSLVNRASYSGYVHGRKQPAYHKRTGWKTTETALKDEAPQVARIITTQYIKEVRP